MHENNFEGMQVLLVEDDAVVRKGARQSLELAGLQVTAVATAEEALPYLVPEFAGILLSDIKLPGIDGLKLLDIAVAQDASLPVILVTGHGDVSMAVGAMRRGAYDFIEKPFSADLLVEVCRRALDKRHLVLENMNLRRQLDHARRHRARIGAAARHGQGAPAGADLAPKCAAHHLLVETGTGKELIAPLPARLQRARDHPFVAITAAPCPNRSSNRTCSGARRSAFTGAQRQLIGKIEYSNGGTLFLDENRNMPLALQVKLLRVLQDRQVERLGSKTNSFPSISASSPPPRKT